MKSQETFVERKQLLMFAAAGLVGLALLTLPALGQGAKKPAATRALKQYTIEPYSR